MASDRIFSVPIYWSALSIDSKFRHAGQATKPDFVLHFFFTSIFALSEVAGVKAHSGGRNHLGKVGIPLSCWTSCGVKVLAELDAGPTKHTSPRPDFWEILCTSSFYFSLSYAFCYCYALQPNSASGKPGWSNRTESGRQQECNPDSLRLMHYH